MRLPRPAIVAALCLSVAIQTVGTPQAQAEHWYHHWILHSLHRTKPPMQRDATVETLAQEIDYLEHHIDTFGTVVAKQPDVWGQSRLTKYRQEYERIMAGELTKFTDTLQGAIRRSDQAYLGMALALDSAANGATTTVSNNTALNMISPFPSGDPITRTPPGKPDLTDFATSKISLEPTVHIDQLSRYLNHLQEMRRINEGDDTADSPGYSLNLVRIPISITPGKMTRKGYGAEITITAEPYLSDELLPKTFRNLIVNDVIDQLGLCITKTIENRELMNSAFADSKHRLSEGAASYAVQDDSEAIATERGSQVPATADIVQKMAEAYSSPNVRGTTNNSADKIIEQLSRSLTSTNRIQSFALSPRRSALAYPPTQMTDVFGLYQVLLPVVLDASRTISPNGKTKPNLLDVQGFLHAELDSAYDFLAQDDAQVLWTHCSRELAVAIRTRQRYMRANDHQPTSRSIAELRGCFFKDVSNMFPRAAYTTTTSLAWAIIVEAALLNERLIDDMRQTASLKGCACLGTGDAWLDYYLPNPSPEARESFNQYVRCRWPIQVFALDPATDDQNVADIFSRRREMQLALAVGVAQGNVRANAAMRFMRRLELDMETIALNRTAVGFAHGNDTFGWRFYPRVQSPETPGTLVAFGQTLLGGPSRDQDLRDRQLEPAMRECVAVVVMPSFVPYVKLDTRSNWFCITHPRKVELTMHEAMKLSRIYQGVRNQLPCIRDSGAYRAGDVGRLARVIDQMDRQLPLQSMTVPIPFENELGGFEMFSTGITDLGPELTGFYGEPGVYVNGKTSAVKPAGIDMLEPFQCKGTCKGTNLFLVGNRFSVHDTKVIAGGRCVPFVLMSRQIMRVTIPADVLLTSDVDGWGAVHVHVATPYGVTGHLLIPAIDSGESCQELPTPAPPFKPAAQPAKQSHSNPTLRFPEQPAQYQRVVTEDNPRMKRLPPIAP